MPSRTWSDVTQHVLPATVAVLRRAGVDTTGWAIDNRTQHHQLVVLDENRVVTRVLRIFTGPADAATFFETIRWTCDVLPQPGVANWFKKSEIDGLPVTNRYSIKITARDTEEHPNSTKHLPISRATLLKAAAILAEE